LLRVATLLQIGNRYGMNFYQVVTLLSLAFIVKL
jgi:hypothetical protein